MKTKRKGAAKIARKAAPRPQLRSRRAQEAAARKDRYEEGLTTPASNVSKLPKRPAKAAPEPEAPAEEAAEAGRDVAVLDPALSKRQEQAQHKLDPMAREINVRLEKAEKQEQQADDHRLAASLVLAKAKAQCMAAQINFKKWCEAHLEHSYETARKLAAIGASDNPRAALEDMRGRNAAANRKLREAQKAALQQVKRLPPRQLSAPPAEQAREVLARVPDAEAVAIAKHVAESHGFRMIPENQMLDVTPTEPEKVTVVELELTVDGMLADFQELEPSEQVEFLKSAAEEIGAELRLPDFVASAGAGA